jgi:alpha-beta hydrolase superfamily lysophospholipase
MTTAVQREQVRFVSGDAVTKEPGTDRFAQRFQAAGFGVLAFDYRRIGESGGEPRLVLRVKEQLADWQAAIGFAASLPGIDPTKLAIWGFSVSGGYVVDVAAANPAVSAAIAQMPNLDGRASVRNAARYQKPLAMLRLTGRGILDALGGLVGRQPLLVPLVAAPGQVALLTTPDIQDGGRVLDPDNRYPEWQQAVAARSALPLGFYRPIRRTARVRCPLLFVVCDEDRTALAEPAIKASNIAPYAELVMIAGGHYQPFLDGHEQTVEAELSFLRRHLLEASPADRTATAESAR